MVRGRRGVCHEDWRVGVRGLASHSLPVPYEAAGHKSAETWDERERDIKSSLCELPQMTVY